MICWFQNLKVAHPSHAALRCLMRHFFVRRLLPMAKASRHVRANRERKWFSPLPHASFIFPEWHVKSITVQGRSSQIRHSAGGNCLFMQSTHDCVARMTVWKEPLIGHCWPIVVNHYKIIANHQLPKAEVWDPTKRTFEKKNNCLFSNRTVTSII